MNCEDYEEIDVLSGAETFPTPLSEENKKKIEDGLTGGIPLEPIHLNSLLFAIICQLKGE